MSSWEPCHVTRFACFNRVVVKALTLKFHGYKRRGNVIHFALYCCPLGTQKYLHSMNFYPPSSLFPPTPLTMNHPGPPVSHPIHPWSQSQQTPQSEEYIPSTLPYTQDRVVNYNHESKVYGQQSIATIPFELLNQQTTFEALPRGLKEIIFLGPRPSSIEYFRKSRHDMFTARVIRLLEHVQLLEKITFSLDFTDLTRILETLATIPGMEEIELTLPTASKIELLSMNMVDIQNTFIAGLEVFCDLKRLTIPMEFVTTLLLSNLAVLPKLESLTVKYSPPPRQPNHHHHQFPAWGSHTIPADCPGYVFIAHLKFDPRGYFRQLLQLDLGAPLSDASFTILRTLFPKTYIRWTESMALRN